MDHTQDPDFNDVIEQFGEAGQRLVTLGASEGCGGNLSVCVTGTRRPHPAFTLGERVELPVTVSNLAGCSLVVTGSGTRMRDLQTKPAACLAILQVEESGTHAWMLTAPSRGFKRVTSEFNSHLVVHAAQANSASSGCHAIVHAQPRKLTYLSHISEYQNEDYLNRRLFRWQAETALSLPEGISVVPFHSPSSSQLMQANAIALRERQAAVWSKHGVMARSGRSLAAAVDLVEYLEAAAEYECLDLALGQRAQGLEKSELTHVCAQYGVTSSLLGSW